MNKFSELPLSTLLQSNLMKHGFVQPTPVQSEAIPPALAGRDVVATAQTGTGETLAFILPVIESLTKPDGKPAPGIQALILAPTRELASSQRFSKMRSSVDRRRATGTGEAGRRG